MTEEWAAKARVDVNINSQFSAFLMGLYGSDSDFDQSYYKQFDGNWAVWAGASYQVNEKAAINAQVGYTEEELLSVAANVAYELVPGFKITPEVVYTNYGDTVAAGADKDGWAGILRFQRSF